MTNYSNEKMRENLGKSIDEKKLQAMMELKRAYNAGEITLEEGRRRAKAELGTLEPYEFAVAEQGQQSLDPDECRKEDIQAMIDLFSDVLSTKRPESCRPIIRSRTITKKTMRCGGFSRRSRI